jgi:hypothetical protein
VLVAGPRGPAVLVQPLFQVLDRLLEIEFVLVDQAHVVQRVPDRNQPPRILIVYLEHGLIALQGPLALALIVIYAPDIVDRARSGNVALAVVLLVDLQRGLLVLQGLVVLAFADVDQAYIVRDGGSYDMPLAVSLLEYLQRPLVELDGLVKLLLAIEDAAHVVEVDCGCDVPLAQGLLVQVHRSLAVLYFFCVPPFDLVDVALACVGHGCQNVALAVVLLVDVDCLVEVFQSLAVLALALVNFTHAVESVYRRSMSFIFVNG